MTRPLGRARSPGRGLVRRVSLLRHSSGSGPAGPAGGGQDSARSGPADDVPRVWGGGSESMSRTTLRTRRRHAANARLAAGARRPLSGSGRSRALELPRNPAPRLLPRRVGCSFRPHALVRAQCPAAGVRDTDGGGSLEAWRGLGVCSCCDSRHGGGAAGAFGSCGPAFKLGTAGRIWGRRARFRGCRSGPACGGLPLARLCRPNLKPEDWETGDRRFGGLGPLPRRPAELSRRRDREHGPTRNPDGPLIRPIKARRRAIACLRARLVESGISENMCSDTPCEARAQ